MTPASIPVPPTISACRGRSSAASSSSVSTSSNSSAGSSLEVGFTPLSDSSPCATRCSRTGSMALVYAPGSGPAGATATDSPSERRAPGVTSGQSTGRKTHVSWPAARSPAITPSTGARLSAPSSITGNGNSSASAVFPTAITSSHASASRRHASLGEGLAAMLRERLRRAEPGRRASDEEHARQARMRHVSV